MKDKKEISKNLVIIVIVLSILIYNFFIKKEENFEDIEISENIFTNKTEVQEETIEKVKVHIIGEVNNPGVVELETGARIEDAIILAGGTTNKSDLSRVNLAYILEDGQKIIIPNIDDKFEEDIQTVNEEGVLNKDKNEKININKADINELCKLSGVGEALAQKIINYRNENGMFKNIEDLKNVSGIGDKKYENLKDYISVK